MDYLTTKVECQNYRNQGIILRRSTDYFRINYFRIDYLDRVLYTINNLQLKTRYGKTLFSTTSNIKLVIYYLKSARFLNAQLEIYDSIIILLESQYYRYREITLVKIHFQKDARPSYKDTTIISKGTSIKVLYSYKGTTLTKGTAIVSTKQLILDSYYYIGTTLQNRYYYISTTSNIYYNQK